MGAQLALGANYRELYRLGLANIKRETDAVDLLRNLACSFLGEIAPPIPPPPRSRMRFWLNSSSRLLSAQR
jgi:hypothetical protein